VHQVGKKDYHYIRMHGQQNTRTKTNTSYSLFCQRLSDYIIIIVIIIIIIIKKSFLIDIAVPNTHNLATTITDKQNKYQKLAN